MTDEEQGAWDELVDQAHSEPMQSAILAVDAEMKRLRQAGEDERRCRYTEKRAKEEVSREASTLFDDLKYLLEKVSDASVEILVKRGCSLAIEEYDCRRTGLKEGK